LRQILLRRRLRPQLVTILVKTNQQVRLRQREHVLPRQYHRSIQRLLHRLAPHDPHLLLLIPSRRWCRRHIPPAPPPPPPQHPSPPLYPGPAHSQPSPSPPRPKPPASPSRHSSFHS